VGSITGFYTVLVEGDDFNEPIPDAVKGITDGHLWLSRTLATKGHFPAIDVLQSISRVRSDVTDKDHQRAIRRVLGLTAVYQEIEDMVNIGAYVPGANSEFDLAVQTRGKIIQYLQQEPTAAVTLEQARKQVMDLVAWVDQMEKGIKAATAKAGQRQAVAAK
jgi:flagellum-specific ATP synthase